MEIIDQYVYAVVKQLPEKSRTDVEKELRANIEDMLPAPYEEADVHKVLLSLGNPAALAEEYRETKRYLISPELYGSYMYVLKIVAIIALFAIPAAAFVTVITDTQVVGANIGIRIIVEMILLLIQAIFPIFGCVTLIFAFLERADKKYVQWPFTGKPWTIQDLKTEIPVSNRSIEKSEPIFSIVTSIIFGVAICFFPQLLGWYSLHNSTWSITPLFNEDAIVVYVPFLLSLTVFSVIVAALKLIYQQWTKRLAMINVVFNICNIVFICSFLLNNHIFSEDFISIFADNVNTDFDYFSRIWHWSKIGITLIIVISLVWDTINGWLKTKKSR